VNLAHNKSISFELDHTLRRIAYFRVSTTDQSIESQKSAMGGDFNRVFKDEGVSGSMLAAKRQGFGDLLKYIDKGDVVCVYSVDRLGRDAIDVQTTVRDLLELGVTVDVHGLGPIAGDAGKIILAVLAQVAEGERRKINERTAAGRATAMEHLERTGKTHKGKVSMGRPLEADPVAVRKWKLENKASISVTAKKFDLSQSTIKRYCATE
jgi:putative DNA-invertase from lambdoid prophage Rac